MSEPLIERDEVAALPFNAEFEARYERTMSNARRTRELAERAQAKLDAEKARTA